MDRKFKRSGGGTGGGGWGGGGWFVFKKKTTETCFSVSFSKFITVVSNGKKERKVTLKRRAP